MKKIDEDEVNFLFDWVKNWYPTDAKPKITILLLNEHEWKKFYLEGSEEIPLEEHKRVTDEIAKGLPSQEKELFQEYSKLSEEERMQVVKSLIPHVGSVKDRGFEYWMNETVGMCFSIEELKERCRVFNKPIPRFFKPYLNYDYVIIVSNFFNKKQRNTLAKNRTETVQRQMNFLIHNAIFHELIHVVERCAGRTFFDTDDPNVCNKITFKLAAKYLD
jgi:hypothetical protein